MNRNLRIIHLLIIAAFMLGIGTAVAEESSPRLDIYGAAMLDMGYQSGQSDPLWFDVVRPTKLPSYENEYGEDGRFFSGVRQSRFGVQSYSPTDLGELHTIFEFELFGVGDDAGQTTFRLRHAWGELGQFGAGQTWSPFMDPDVFPNSIEYWGPNAMVFFRNVQFRWTPMQKDNGSRFVLALERPGASGDAGVFSDRVELEDIQGRFPAPDFSTHYRHAADWGHLQAAGILRYIKWDDLGADAFDYSGDATGWGINLSSNVKLSRHLLRLSLVYGEGIQNYMNDATADIGIDGTPGDPASFSGTPMAMTGVVGFIDLNWNEKWTSTAGYSYLDIDNTEAQSDDAFAVGHYALANILYHPTGDLFLGPEFQWAKRENFRDGFTSDDFRVQFSVKYNFSHTLGGK